jgi:hypothetical protein
MAIEVAKVELKTVQDDGGPYHIGHAVVRDALDIEPPARIRAMLNPTTPFLRVD